jgi:hypothetical protein
LFFRLSLVQHLTSLRRPCSRLLPYNLLELQNGVNTRTKWLQKPRDLEQSLPYVLYYLKGSYWWPKSLPNSDILE